MKQNIIIIETIILSIEDDYLILNTIIQDNPIIFSKRKINRSLIEGTSIPIKEEQPILLQIIEEPGLYQIKFIDGTDKIDITKFNEDKRKTIYQQIINLNIF